MTAPLVICQFNEKPHALDDECQNVIRVPQWMVDEGRLDCEHSYYTYPGLRSVFVCRCLICANCNKHSENTHQGHHAGWCRVTRTIRTPHFCCPTGCELGES